jgi:hypothetical protein
MHPDVLATMVEQRSRSLLHEAENRRLAKAGQSGRPARRPARPWRRWVLRSPIVRRRGVGDGAAA